MIVKKALSILAAVAIACCALAMPAAAQITTGSIAGSVKDAQGGVIPGATVVLTNEAQGTKSTPVVTNGTGDFVFPNVPAGTYTILTWHERYGPLMQSVRVRAGATTTVDFAYTGDEKPPA